MDLAAIEGWLRNTVPGLIFLGAVGSILALWLLRCLRLVYRLVVRGREAYLKREFDKGYLTGTITVHLAFKPDPVIASAWFSFKIARLAIALVVFLAAFAVLLFVLPSRDMAVLTGGSLALVIVCFLALRWAFEEFRDIRTAFDHLVLPLVQEARDAVKEEKTSGDSNEDRGRVGQS